MSRSPGSAAQVLLIMAEELGKFIPLVGGPAHGHVLLQPLEALSMVEETVVRDKAVESINLVAAELPEASISEHLIPLVQVGAVAVASTCWHAAADAVRSIGTCQVHRSGPYYVHGPGHLALNVCVLVPPPAAAGDGRVVHVAGVVVRGLRQRVPARAGGPAGRPAGAVCTFMPRRYTYGAAGGRAEPGGLRPHRGGGPGADRVPAAVPVLDPGR